ncbi:molybdenum cofactor guanylyltransferase [Helicobacter pullorum]|uniref:molybdenum cofactor guanylyltransferase n=1 Tax=Helicobacter pullorum TaxID=35818 RepID=UPI00174DF88B|nr:molybdenum cofactor guanylyltransferase [Helicobacter pullorum]
MEIENCIILCGGKSSRMGKKKETLDFFGQSLADFQANKMQKIFKKVYFSSKTTIQNSCKIPTILDFSAEFAAIFGLESSLKTLSQSLFVVSIDSPFLTQQSIAKLQESYQKTKKSTFAKNKKIHPLLGIYTYDSLIPIQKQISQKNYRLMELLGIIGTNFIEIEESQTQNLNTPYDYLQATQGFLDG